MVESCSTDDHAATVREALETLPEMPFTELNPDGDEQARDSMRVVAHDGIAALDALVSLAEQHRQDALDYQHAYTDANEARESAERERDVARDAHDHALAEYQSLEARADAAEAALRAAQAREEELEKALLGWESRDHDGQEPCSIERGAGKTLEVMVSGLTYDQAEAIEDWLAAVLAASPQAGEVPSGGLLEQPMRRDMGVDAPDFGPVLGESNLCDHCGRSLGVARNEITVDGSVVSVGVECRDCAGDETDEHAERKAAAEQELCRAADAYVWEPTDETMEALRNARAEWQTAVGRWRLARRWWRLARRQAGVSALLQPYLMAALPAPGYGDQRAARQRQVDPGADVTEGLSPASGTWGTSQSLHARKYQGVTA